jgi:hypothetical protein
MFRDWHGNPGVFQGYLYPYPRKPIPVFQPCSRVQVLTGTGTGFPGEFCSYSRTNKKEAKETSNNQVTSYNLQLVPAELFSDGKVRFGLVLEAFFLNLELNREFSSTIPPEP